MLTERTPLQFAFALVCLFLTLSGCSGEQTFDVRGRVAGFGDDDRTIFVEHEEIPGYMAAMTMPFETDQSVDLSRFEMGDALSFELVVDGSSAYIRNLEVLPDSALPEHPAGTALPSTSYSDNLLEEGDAVPEIELLTHADTTLTFEELAGTRVLLTFTYTSCPIPDYCPLMSRHFAAIQDRLADQPSPVHLLTVSFDPETDTPQVLRSYAERYTDDLSNWTFATGEPDAIRRFAERFGVYYQTQADQIIHNLVTVLINTDGRIEELWRGNDWTPDDVLEAL